MPLAAQPVDVWIGTAKPRGGTSRGIYHLTIDSKTGELSSPELAAELDSPGFLTLHPDQNHLYAVCSIEGEGSVMGFRLDRGSGGTRLESINSQSIGDGQGTHLCVDQTGHMLMTAQYGGGSVAVFALESNGAIGSRTQLIEHQSAPGDSQQATPHPHWIGTDRANRFAFVPDLGLDQIVLYRIDHDKACLVPHWQAALPAGSGPRHMTFHPSLSVAYVLNELSLTVTALRYDQQAGQLAPVQGVEALPKQLQEADDSASEIRIHPTGQFLYTGNRGHDSISVFSVNPADGLLTLVEREPIRGSCPRNFNLTPDGRWLVAAGQDSNTLSVFRIDQENGELVFNRRIVNVPTPICVLFSTP
jgi:6-phosphogluconolactonase